MSENFNTDSSRGDPDDERLVVQIKALIKIDKEVEIIKQVLGPKISEGTFREKSIFLSRKRVVGIVIIVLLVITSIIWLFARSAESEAAAEIDAEPNVIENSNMAAPENSLNETPMPKANARVDIYMFHEMGSESSARAAKAIINQFGSMVKINLINSKDVKTILPGDKFETRLRDALHDAVNVEFLAMRARFNDGFNLPGDSGLPRNFVLLGDMTERDAPNENIEHKTIDMAMFETFEKIYEERVYIMQDPKTNGITKEFISFLKGKKLITKNVSW